MNKKVILSNFVAAALAGILIGLGGTTYLSLTSMGAPIIGALLFGFGLFTILEF
jgi:formate/nitrite transporter FocA (FNT family)